MGIFKPKRLQGWEYFDNNGQEVNKESIIIPAGGQESLSLGGVAEKGWCRITSNRRLQGLALIGNSSFSTMYDIDMQNELHTSFIVSHVAADAFWQSTLMICNPSPLTTTINLTWANKNGLIEDPGKPISIPANGGLQINLADHFGKNLEGGALAIASAPASVTAFMLYDGTGSGQQHWKAGLSAVSAD